MERLPFFYTKKVHFIKIIYQESDEVSNGITTSPVVAIVDLVELEKAVIAILNETKTKLIRNVDGIFATLKRDVQNSYEQRQQTIVNWNSFPLNS